MPARAPEPPPSPRRKSSPSRVAYLARAAACRRTLLGGLAALAFLSTPRCAASRAADYPASTALPRFATFGWASPPVDSGSVARLAQYAAAGFNLVLPPLDDAGKFNVNLARLARSDGLGLANVLADWQLNAVMPWLPWTLGNADSVVARYGGDPSFAGYYLGDEPQASSFGGIGQMFEILRERDPLHPAWNNLLGRGSFASDSAFRAYLQQYVAAAHPAVLCDDHYDFYTWGDRHLFVPNVAVTAEVARANGLPFWGVVQVVQCTGLRPMQAGLLRWQVAQWLAYGARGIGYFTYWTPPADAQYGWQPAMIDRATGVPTPLYGMVRDVNLAARPVGEQLASARWVRTVHSGPAPAGSIPFTPDDVLSAVVGRAVLGMFVDSLANPLLLVGNSDSTASQRLALVLSDGRSPSVLAPDGSDWDPLPRELDGTYRLALDAGAFVLLQVTPGLAHCRHGDAARLRASPEPARGAVTFALGGSSAGLLELVDVTGRRVWERAIGPGVRSLTWRGESDAGQPVSAGIYFLRLSRGGRRVVRRVTWLGAS